MGGHTLQSAIDFFNLYVIKLNYTGDVLWEKSIGGPLTDVTRTIIQTKDNGYLIGGTSDSYGGSSTDMILVKLNQSGFPEWAKIYGNTNNEQCTSVRQTNDGGFIISGFQNPIEHDNDSGRGILIKTNNKGEIEWQNVYGAGVIWEFTAVNQTTDGNYIVTGSAIASSNRDQDILLLKTDSHGKIIWNKIYVTKGVDRGIYLEQARDGGYFLGGHFQGGDSKKRQQIIIKTSKKGITQWANTYKGNRMTGFADWGTAFTQTRNGGIISVGWSASEKAHSEDLIITKTSPEGSIPCNNDTISVLERDKAIKKASISLKPLNIRPEVIDLERNLQSRDMNLKLLCQTTSCIQPHPSFSSDKNSYCLNDTLKLKNTSTGATQFKWFINDNLVSTNKSPNIPHNQKDDFVLKLQAINGACDSTVTHRIEVNRPPALSITGDQTICKGTTLQLSVSGASEYTWFPKNNISCQNCPSPKVTPDRTTTYFVQGTNQDGCTSLDSVVVKVQSIKFNYKKITACNALSGISFENNSIATDSLIWNFGDGNNSTSKNPTHQYTEPGIYEVILQTKQGRCYVKKQIEIQPKTFVPNIITPNNDAKNDYFRIKTHVDRSITLKIFNRWGKMIFNTQNYRNDWQASGLPSGNYFYIIKLKNKECKGWLKVMQ